MRLLDFSLTGWPIRGQHLLFNASLCVSESLIQHRDVRLVRRLLRLWVRGARVPGAVDEIMSTLEFFFQGRLDRKEFEKKNIK